MSPVPHGADDPRAKLTWEQAEEVRQRYLQGETDMRALSREYGVSRACIWKILNDFSYVRQQ